MVKLRKGQEMYNFLSWLREEKGYGAGQARHMADPFHIPDAEWQDLWKEFHNKDIVALQELF